MQEQFKIHNALSKIIEIHSLPQEICYLNYVKEDGELRLQDDNYTIILEKSYYSNYKLKVTTSKFNHEFTDFGHTIYDKKDESTNSSQMLVRNNFVDCIYNKWFFVYQNTELL